jgi:hypothetical protein
MHAMAEQADEAIEPAILDIERSSTMAANTDGTLRELIRLIPPIQALKEDLEQNLQMELYEGTGDLAIRSFQGLQASVARITNDPYVASLALDVPATADDRQKVSLARLAAGQLAAFLEGQTGVASLGGGSGDRSITVRSPQTFVGSNITGLQPETLQKIVGIAEATTGAAKGEGEGS